MKISVIPHGKQHHSIFHCAGLQAFSGSNEGLTDHSTPDLDGVQPRSHSTAPFLPNAGKDEKGLSERGPRFLRAERVAGRRPALLLVNKRITGHE